MAGLPAFLKVEEAAWILRIGRTTAYLLAQQFLRTGGREGLPVVVVGRSLRVPTAKLAHWAGCELELVDEAAPALVVPIESHAARRPIATPGTSPDPSLLSGSQSRLPFTS